MKYTQVALFRVEGFLVSVSEVHTFKGDKLPYVQVDFTRKGLVIKKFMADGRDIVERIEAFASQAIEGLSLQDWEARKI